MGDDRNDRERKRWIYIELSKMNEKLENWQTTTKYGGGYESLLWPT